MPHTVPASERRQPNYVAIWTVLVAALAVSMGFAYIDRPLLAASLIFAVAIVKAFLVVAFYMHLKFEPGHVLAIVIAGLLALFVLFVGLVPDIVHV